MTHSPSDSADVDICGMAGRSVLAVFAHPDDESLACGGTLARLADEGAIVILLCASRGERGTGPDHRYGPGDQLAHVRTAELHAAAGVLGISRLIMGDHPDGSLRWADERALQEEIAAAMEAHRPDAVITFDSDGLYWHADHVGVHERTRAAALSFGDEAPALFFVSIKPGMMREVAETAARTGWMPPPTGLWSITPDAWGLGVEPPSFAVHVAPWVDRKLAALACYRSQFRVDNPFTRLDAPDARRLLGVEYFRRAPLNRRTAAFERYGEPLEATHA